MTHERQWAAGVKWGVEDLYYGLCVEGKCRKRLHGWLEFRGNKEGLKISSKNKAIEIVAEKY